MRFQILALFILSLSCKQDKLPEKKLFDDELTEYLTSRMKMAASKEGQKVDFLKLIGTDSVSESQVSNYIADFTFKQLSRLSTNQQTLGHQIPHLQNEKQVKEWKKKFRHNSDSIEFYRKLSDKIFNSTFDSLKIEYHEYRYLLRTKSLSNSNVRTDTLYFYSRKNNRKELIPEFKLLQNIIENRYSK